MHRAEMQRIEVRFTLGSGSLVLSVVIVAGFAVAGLAGWVAPVTGAVVGIGAQVVGTVAFFVAYYMVPGNRPSPRAPRNWCGLSPQPGSGSERRDFESIRVATTVSVLERITEDLRI